MKKLLSDLFLNNFNATLPYVTVLLILYLATTQHLLTPLNSKELYDKYFYKRSASILNYLILPLILIIDFNKIVRVLNEMRVGGVRRYKIAMMLFLSQAFNYSTIFILFLLRLPMVGWAIYLLMYITGALFMAYMFKVFRFKAYSPLVYDLSLTRTYYKSMGLEEPK